MAWTVKPSATMEIPRRNEPYLSADMLSRYREVIVPRYETKLACLMPILHDVQREYGWIPPQAMEEIAAFLSIDASQVLDTASFYEEFHTHPVGEHVIAICQSIACEACGHQAIIDHVRNRLDIEPHETTDDGKFTLLALECLGSCDTAPCALVDDDRHDDLTIAAIDQVIDRLSS
ncbi:MAG: NADH-quinone oxidoreductase subunit NuoE [Planctomycetes bacterium]|jgi:NADH-quinone oxidoreductase subunit E|nr:NADH-quinone oxidoreductase subunit NuoE [Planctomycetota bacterium]MCP4838422.1 NADH-quinone oxidoreductase subunit NuoE [Planctomycetota bacterium]